MDDRLSLKCYLLFQTESIMIATENIMILPTGFIKFIMRRYSENKIYRHPSDISATISREDDRHG